MSKMKIQEIFNEYIELKAYTTCSKIVFTEITLYNSYIKSAFGNKEVSTLLTIDYQNFTNSLLSDKYKYQQKSRDRIEQICCIYQRRAETLLCPYNIINDTLEWFCLVQPNIGTHYKWYKPHKAKQKWQPNES